MELNIIPYPNSVEHTNGHLTIDGSSSVYSDKPSRFAASVLLVLLEGGISRYSGGMSTSQEALFLFLTDKTLPPEEYSLEIKEKIVIRAGDEAGFNYAVQTLRQYLDLDRETRLDRIVCNRITIHDAPNHSFRGFMLDEARHFFGMNAVKHILDLMAILKLNKFHWHISDDQGFRIESFQYPKITSISTTRTDSQVGGFLSEKYRGIGHSGYYTQTEVKEIVDYAMCRGIEVIPELSLPGHITALMAAYPQLSCKGESVVVKNRFGTSEHVLCAGKDSTYAFLCGLIDELVTLFPSKYFHLGGNFVPKSAWQSCPDCCAKMVENSFNEYDELSTYFFNRISEHLVAIGKTPIIRNDAVYENTNDTVLGDYYIKLADDSFHGYLNDGGAYFCSRHKYYYLDHPYAKSPLKKVYNYNPKNEEFSSSFNGNLIGLEAVLNTEWIYDREKLDFSIFPRLMAIAETAWTKSQLKNYDGFKKRLRSFGTILKKYGAVSAKLSIAECKNPLVRVREFVRWALSDQYSEVRKNRR